MKKLTYEQWLANHEAYGVELKTKWAIDSEQRYEKFYICGEDLEDAFNANNKYIEFLESVIKRQDYIIKTDTELLEGLETLI